MLLKQILLILISINLFSNTFAQSKTATLNGDCFNAVEIIPEGNFTFKKSPKGYGEKLEFNNNPSNSIYYFQEENNTAWFTFVARDSGTLVFKIQPKNIEADFDFLLFEYTNNDFCKNISHNRPIRTNISRNNQDEQSITGLSSNSSEEFVKSGIGNPWSKVLHLKRGQRYYLVINKANDIETPFRILFKSKYPPRTSTSITGVFKDSETGEIIKNVHVTIQEKWGDILSETTSDSITGEFSISVPFSKSTYTQKYILSGSKDAYFFTEKSVNISPEEIYIKTNPVLNKLKKGKNLTLNSINFVGNMATILPGSEASLERLFELMKMNETLKIKIEGHTNGCSNGVAHAQKLSENRAKTVKDFLISKEIDENRITIKGYGCSKMLYSVKSSEENQSNNRRVEIFVLEY
jgi:outer membrane protein OmpA-like peptidoglycan-associated protein